MKDEFLSIIMECAASIVNEKNSENSLLRDECGENAIWASTNSTYKCYC